MQTIVNNVNITGLSAAIPDNKISIKNHCKQMNLKLDNNIIRASNMLGVKSNYISSKNQTTADLCYVAANKLLNEINWDTSSVDILIFVSQTPDYLMPSTSCILQDKLKLKKTTAVFDINLGCSGYVYGLWVCSSILENSNAKRALLLVGDTISKTVGNRDISNKILFGDAGTATALEYTKKKNPIFFSLGTDGSGEKDLYIPNSGFRQNIKNKFLIMNGSNVFSFVFKEIPKSIKELLIWSKFKIKDIDYFVFHQANRFMLKKVFDKIEIPYEKTLIKMEQFGNTSSATIPLTIVAENKKILMRKKNRFLLSGFGAGFSWASACLELNQIKILDLIKIK